MNNPLGLQTLFAINGDCTAPVCILSSDVQIMHSDFLMDSVVSLVTVVSASWGLETHIESMALDLT